VSDFHVKFAVSTHYSVPVATLVTHEYCRY